MDVAVRKRKIDSPSGPEVDDKLTVKTNSSDAPGVNKPVVGSPPPFAANSARPPFSPASVNSGAKIQTSERPVRATRNQNPNYVSYIALPA